MLSVAQGQVRDNSENDPFGNLLQRRDQLRALRIVAWVRRFTTDRHHKGPLSSDEAYEVKDGDAVIVKTENKNKGKWPLAIAEKLFPDPDGRTRAAQLKTKNGEIERPV